MIIGIIVMSILDLIGGIAGFMLFAGSMSEDVIKALHSNTGFLLYALVLGFLTTSLGGYICAKFGKLAPYKNSAIFGAIGVIIGLFFATFDPVWFDIVSTVAVIPAAMLGGYFVAIKNA